VRRLPFDVLVPVVLGGTVVAFAAGSSSVTEVVAAARTLRWVALLLLLLVAAASAVVRDSRPTLRPSIALALVCFVGLAVESAVWSVYSRITVERAGTLVLLFASAVSLAVATAGRLPAIERALTGIVGGAVVVVLSGLFVLAFDRSAAVEQATFDLPPRYRGFGENPNTVPLLVALCLPIAVWFAFQARRRLARGLSLLVALGFDAQIVAGGSRGALIAGFCGVLLVIALAPTTRRLRVACAVGATALLAISILVALTPKSKGEAAAPPASHPAAPTPKPKAPRYLDIQAIYPLEFDIGTMLPGEQAPTSRTLFGLSGRGEAWRGALDLADQRPALGYGFGTEDRVFVDRYANFAGGLPENSYIGLYLQLGAAGVAAFALLVASLVIAAARAAPRREGAVVLGVVAAALMLGMVQSYIYSVGNIGTVTVWVCAFLSGAAVVGRRAAA
jgi:hypothetical protein